MSDGPDRPRDEGGENRLGDSFETAATAPAKEPPAAPDSGDAPAAVADRAALGRSSPNVAATPAAFHGAHAGASVAQPKSGRGIAVFALFLILIWLASVGGAVGWFAYQGTDPFDYLPVPTIERAEQRIAALEAELRNSERRRRAAVEREAEVRSGIEELSQALRSLASDVGSESPIDDRQWRIAETAYLLRVANLRAGVEGDRAGAEALLRAADELLREIDDFGLLPVRERIAEALAELRTAVAVDRTGLYLELEALGEVVNELPLDMRAYEGASTRGADLSDDADIAREDGEVPWTEMLRDRFAGLVDFRVHRPAPVRTLVAPGDVAFVRHTLLLKIEQAQLALLRKDAEVWRLALAEARRWTEDYFDVEDGSVRGLLSALARLEGERVAVRAPDLSAPHNALMRLRGRASFLDPVKAPGQ